MFSSSSILVLSMAAIMAWAQNTSYIGCVATSPEGFNRPLSVNMANFQKVKASRRLCASWCKAGSTPDGFGFNYDFPMFAMDNYACYCGFHLAQGARLVSDSACSEHCAGDDSVSCGGPERHYSLYGDDEYLTQPGYLAGLTFDGCKKFDATKFTGPKYQDAVKMTVNSCTRFCVQGNGKYGVTLDKDNNCYCTDRDLDVGTDVKDVDYACNHPCAGDRRQTCGGHTYDLAFVSHWKFRTTM
ncbi:hypothetical protein E4U44_007628 [Claviceps purpurea]|nr:hypothetical protein E4U45_007222 [Claviceps purpurea]KAG6318768.1 hypothetical protein E4U44_007628 [Claviceps purpurea]